MQTFAENMGVKIIHIDATAQFMGKLSGVADPEAKRKIIGREFVEVFQDQAGKQKSAKWLAQGTIYPDVIESAGAKTGKATSIKSHHNVGGLPDTLNLKLLEPLRELFRTKSANWAWPWACRRRWSTVIRSRGLAWACGSWARSSTSTPNCCVAPMRSSSKSCATPGRGQRPDLVRADLAGVCRVPAGEVGGGDGDGRTYEYVVRCARCRRLTS